MTDEQVYKIIAKFEGEEKAKTLAAAVSLAEQKFEALYSQLGRGDAATKAAAASLGDLRQQLARAQSEISLSGHKLMQLGQTLDDLQYVGEQGLRPIINNVMQLSPALGVAMIAAQLLYSNWDSLAKLFGMGHVKTQAEEMEELAKKTSKTAGEFERLARAQGLTSKVDELRAAKPEEQRKTEEAATRAIVEAGSREVAAGVLKSSPELVDGQGDAAGAKKELDGLKAYAAEQRRRRDDASLDPETRNRADAALAGMDEKLTEAERKLLEARKKTAEELAATGALPGLFPGGLKQLQDLVAKDPAAFGPKSGQLADDLKAASPEAREEAEEAAAQAKLEKDEADFNYKLYQFQREAIEARERERMAQDERVAEAELQAADDVRKLDEDAAKAAKARRKQEVEDVKKSLPGLEDLIRDQLKRMMGAGMGANQAADKLTGQLAGRFGIEAANDLVQGQKGAAQGGLMADFLKGPDTDRRKSSVIGAEGLADSIQSAVGGEDIQKKQLEQLQRQTSLFEQIVNRPRRPGGGGLAVFDAQGNLKVD